MVAEERVFIALGSNVGDRESLLAFAVGALAAVAGVEVVATSPVYETAAISSTGPLPQTPYLNAAVEVRSELEPSELLAHQLEIELWKVLVQSNLTSQKQNSGPVSPPR